VTINKGYNTGGTARRVQRVSYSAKGMATSRKGGFGKSLLPLVSQKLCHNKANHYTAYLTLIGTLQCTKLRQSTLKSLLSQNTKMLQILWASLSVLVRGLAVRPWHRLGAHRLSFVPNGPSSSFFLLIERCGGSYRTSCKRPD